MEHPRRPKIFTPPEPLQECLLGYVAEAKDPHSSPSDRARIYFEESFGCRARAYINLTKAVVKITFKAETIPAEPKSEDVLEYEFRSSKPYPELEREAVLADIESGRYDRVTIARFIWLFNLDQRDLDMLKRKGGLTIFSDAFRSGTKYIYANDILALNNRIEAMRAAEEAGQ
jgi:hypothetical protein